MQCIDFCPFNRVLFNFNREQPRINSKTIDLERLKTLPECTFGKVYSDWLADNVSTYFVDDQGHNSESAIWMKPKKLHFKFEKNNVKYPQ